MEKTDRNRRGGGGRKREKNRTAETLHQAEYLMTKLCFFGCCCFFFLFHLPSDYFFVVHLQFSNMHIQQTAQPSSIYRWRWWRNHIKDFHRNENQCVGNYLMLCSIKCHLRFSVNYVIITNYDFIWMLIFFSVDADDEINERLFFVSSQQFLSTVRCSLIEIAWILYHWKIKWKRITFESI